MSTNTPAPRQMSLDWQPWNLVGKSQLWFSISGILMLLTLLYMGLNIGKYGTPLRLGIDFTGGTLISFSYEGAAAEKVNASRIEEIVRGIDQQAPTVQISGGSEGQRAVLIRASAELAGAEGAEKLGQLFDALESEFGPPMAETESISEVSATISGELITKALEGLFWGMLMVFVYVTIRMRLDFAAFGILALFHDVIVALGFMAFASYHLGWEVNSWFVAVILTIVGYSINDTIVIYDRIRENLHLFPRADFPALVNLSLNQTLTRSIYTSLTVWFVLISMLVGQSLQGGAGGLKEFNAVMLAGMISGAYSSIFVSAQALVVYYKRRERLGLVGFQAEPEEIKIEAPSYQSPTIAQLHRVPEASGEATGAPAVEARKVVKGADILGKARPAGSAAPAAGATRPKKKRW